jgi:hypothetical protein
MLEHKPPESTETTAPPLGHASPSAGMPWTHPTPGGPAREAGHGATPAYRLVEGRGWAWIAMTVTYATEEERHR